MGMPDRAMQGRARPSAEMYITIRAWPHTHTRSGSAQSFYRGVDQRSGSRGLAEKNPPSCRLRGIPSS